MSRQARDRRRRRGRGPGRRLLLIGGGVVLCALIVSVIAALGYVDNVASHTKNPCRLRPVISGGSSQVYAADGTRLGFIRSEDLRSPVSGGQLPNVLKEATIAIEDQRFWKNNGVDPTGIFRAAVKDITHGKALQGGSTIAMQLMRNLYMRNDTHKLKQKIEEAKMAIDYEKCRTKQQVLTEYLNSIPYGTVGGQTMIGAQAAARVFFNKPVWALNLEQAALLAGLPQAPSEYNPFRDASAARKRRNAVISKMADLHYISRAKAAAAEQAPLQTHAGNFYTQRREDFFFEYVRKQLDSRYGRRIVERGGLKVTTTISLNMQRLARKAIAGVLNQPEDPASAVVTINPANGNIEAMAESESYKSSQYNLAADGHRQPGSTFKAIVLADALSRGVDPNSTVYDSHTLPKGWLQGYPEYEVKTFGGEQNGPIDLVQATLKSDNTVYAQLAADLGETTVTEMAHKMGVSSKLESLAAEALGGLTLGVTPLEMANVYATLANGGIRNTPIAITKVVFPDGHVDTKWGKPHRVRVLSEAVAAEETSILHQNVLGGTAARSAITCPTAAKTGTTSELVDAWLDGYSPRYSTVVWMGYPNKRVSMTSVHGQSQQGGYLPAEIWHAYMAGVTEGQQCPEFPSSKEAISYTPFYGKFAATGQAASAAQGEEKESKKSKKRPSGRHGGAQSPRPAPQSGPPGVNRTGGAGPH
jgi:penicillin-binding protein 1A